MKAGLLITNDFLTITRQEENGDLNYAAYNGDKEVFLYFQYDEGQNPPVVLDKEAREVYFPGNEEVLGDFLKFLDSENDTYEKSNLSFKNEDVLNSILDDITNQNSDVFSASARNEIDPFYLILPPYIGEIAKRKVIHGFQQRVNNGRIADQLYPYVFHLLNEGKIPASGNVLYVEMCFSDFYFYSLHISTDKGKQKIEIVKEEKIIDTDLLYQFLRVISEELVGLVVSNYSSSENYTKEQLEEEIIYNLSDAQDIMIGLSEIDEWSEIEIEAELSDGTGGPVKLKKDNIQKRFINVVEKCRLKATVDSLIKEFNPSAMVFVGENFNNWGVSEFFQSYKDRVVIAHDRNYYEHIFNLVFSQDEVCSELDVDKLSVGQLVTLYNFNSDPNKGSKGASEHDLKYLGNMEFAVERSTRSLQIGMTLRSQEKIWKKEMRLGFNVLKADGFSSAELNGKSLKFIMRPNKSITLRKWLN